MSNTITVSINFSFKGETFSPSTSIDLDVLMHKNYLSTIGQESNISVSIYPLLAASINLDTYSYAYEVMLASHAVYSEPTGIAVKHLTQGQFNYQSFYKEWLDEKMLTIVQEIADKHLSVADLAQQPQLKEALFEAFLAGEKSVEHAS